MKHEDDDAELPSPDQVLDVLDNRLSLIIDTLETIETHLQDIATSLRTLAKR